MRNHVTFILKAVSLAAILFALSYYQRVALVRAAEVEEREAQIAEVEAYNAQILAEEKAREDAFIYNDGTYEGTGTGYGGDVIVSVTIKDDVIEDIQLVSAAGEDQAYLMMVQNMLGDMVEVQSADVDVITGATFTSHGLIDAVKDAIGKAVK